MDFNSNVSSFTHFSPQEDLFLLTYASQPHHRYSLPGKKSKWKAGHQWLTPIILATQEAEIKRISVQSQPQANSLQDPISKMPNTKKVR
jgi:hypothetical protein